MKVIIKSMIEIQNVSYEIEKYCKKALTYDNPAYVAAKRRNKFAFNIEKRVECYIYDPVSGSIFVPRGFLEKLKNCIDSDDIIDKRKEFDDIDFGWNSSWNLREYQEQAIEDMYNESGVLISPAGSGKTVMGMKYIDLMSKPTIWLTHTKDLMYQAKDRAEKMLLLSGEIGLIGDTNSFVGDKKLLIANFQTLQRSPELIKMINENYGVAVIDECHHTPSNMFMDVIAKLEMEHMLGLTATPDRKDGLEFLMHLIIGKELHRINREVLYENNQLIKPQIKFVFTNFVDEQTSKISEDGAVNAGGEDINYQGLSQKLYNDEERANLIAENIFNELSPLNYQIVLSESVDYAFKLRDRLKKVLEENNMSNSGIRLEVIHGGLVKYSWMVIESQKQALELVEDGLALDMKYDKKARRWKVKIENYSAEELKEKDISRKERKQILKDVVDKKVHVLFATKLAREGLDIPHLNIGHSVSPKKGDTYKKIDGGAVEQEIGRIMRLDPSNANKKAVWYDYVDYNCGIFKNQYNTRRKVYKRLNLAVPKKEKTKMQKVEDFLHNNDLFI